MLREDDRDRDRREANAHALLVEGVALAVRAKAEIVIDQAAVWRTAAWLEPGVQDAAPVEPPLNLLTLPHVQAAIHAATHPAPVPAAPPDPPVSPPTYRLRKAVPRGSH